MQEVKYSLKCTKEEREEIKLLVANSKEKSTERVAEIIIRALKNNLNKK